MESIIEGFKKAFSLIFGLDAELLGIIFLSLRVSGTALLIVSIIGLPLSALISLKKFPARGLFISIMNTLMGLPPVVVGLFVYMMLSRSGPIGFMGLLYTPSAMIIAQTILAFPIAVSLCHSAIISVNPIIKQASMTLGATSLQTSVTIIKEARYGIMSGMIAAFGRVMAEVGAILIVGGNIAGYTRVMTTTIALETDKGNFELAIALGIILLTISLAINLLLHFVQRKGALPVNR
ncbi:MAG: tungstate transporter permease [Nitrospirae bacterium GWF2_44_13]|nr:MAG: tungstate transporter permease [Nitrospirae bacterium GWF2_44_13]OGW32290.1 MAG: tungstate transporter permease [Nitrospirae bacterium GWD2_44_7]OGW63945.1 MAG: tungstate transporter permease [Nitrospirae bacterium RIFOXYA2_FULL_44_9]HBG93529.1 tungstate transporter permease [Nitrospiraceae bacterium]